MKNYNYKYVVIPGKKIIAISTYAGRTVKGVAKCHPNDEFDVEFGKKLAAARCNEKVADKRFQRATNKYDAAFHKLLEAQKEINRVRVYLEDSYNALDAARRKVHELFGGEVE